MTAKKLQLASLFRYLFIIVAIMMAIAAIATFWKMNHLAQTGVTIMGQVSRIDSQFDRTCGGGSFSKNCTRFKAWIEYTVSGVTYYVEHPAGSVNGTSNDTRHANYQIGDSISVLYDPEHPNIATIGDRHGAGIFRYLVLLMLLPLALLLWRRYQNTHTTAFKN